MEPELGNFNILPLLIQPLVENSIIHGLETKQGGGCIKIAVESKDKTLRINVSDNGIGMKPEALEKLRSNFNCGDFDSGEEISDGRIGLINVNRRIKLYYGFDFGLTISGNDENGIDVCMVIPQVLAEPQKETR
jgi:two-component system sensor histidine kinase YesM